MTTNYIRKNHVRLCPRCLSAIQSRGERVTTLESVQASELYADRSDEDDGLLTCQWCDEEFDAYDLTVCLFR